MSELTKPRLRAAYLAAKAAFPTVELSEGAFRAHIDRLSAQHPRFVARFDRAVCADLYLAFACLEKSTEAIRLLTSQHMAEAVSYAIRHLKLQSEESDLLQELATALLGLGERSAKLALYTGTGPLGAFVRVTALRLAQTSTRKVSRRREDQISDRIVGTENPELLLLRREFATEFAAAVRAAVAQLEGDSRDVLRLFYYESLSLERIAAHFKISRATAGRRVADARDEVLALAKKHLLETKGARGREVESLLRLVISDLDLGLSVVFKGQTRDR